MSETNQTNTFNEVNDICENEQTFHQEQSADPDQEEPSADQEEPSADQEEPSADQDKYQEPSADQDKYQEPSADQDKYQEPSADQDKYQEPSADQDKENVRNQLNELIQVVCRQTELTEEEARERLEKEQYNHMKVLNDYFGFKEIKPDNKSSINQQIYGEIRNLMDNSSRNFRMEQENAQRIQNIKETRDASKK
jgi:hypothetical protein